MSFNFLDVIVFLGLSQGVFLIFSLLKMKDHNTTANKVLALILLLCSLILLARFVYAHHFRPWMIQWITLPDTIILAIGPLTLAYVHFLFNRKKIEKAFLSYFIPFFCYLSLAVFLASSSMPFLLSIGVKNWLPIVYSLVEAFAIGFNLYMLSRVLIVIRRTRNLEDDNLSYRQGAITYLRTFLLGLFAILMLWAVVFVTSRMSGVSLDPVNYNTIWMLIPVLFYIISYFMLGEPKLFRFHHEKKSQSTSRLRPEKITTLSKSLHKLMVEEKVFLDNKLTLKNLAEQAQSSSNDISWLLNEVHKKNFYDYVNSFRVKAFIQELEAKNHVNKTLLSLALDVGFNSKSNFNNTFKKEIGMTPREYLQTLSN